MVSMSVLLLAIFNGEKTLKFMIVPTVRQNDSWDVLDVYVAAIVAKQVELLLVVMQILTT